ncbi:MAG: hypothetical protein ACI9MR_002473 [Myxococcota bacterium]|jgi:hypothetical protein
MRIIATATITLIVGLYGCGDSDTGTTADTDSVLVGDTTPDSATDSGTADTEDVSDDTLAPMDTVETSLPDTVIAPSPLVVERLGARVYGTTIAMSQVGRTLWLGTRANPLPTDRNRLRGGLVALALDLGTVEVVEETLPQGPYYDFATDGQIGPVPTASVQEDGDRLVVVAFDGLLALTGPTGARTVDTFDVTLPGGTKVTPIALGIARDGLRPVAWLTSNLGLLRLDEDTFATEAVFTETDFGVSGQLGPLAIDPDTGDVYAALYPGDGSQTRVVRATVTGETNVWIPETGLVGELVWSAADGVVYAAIGTWNGATGGVFSWDGTTVTPIISEGDLTRASGQPAGAYGAQTLAIDPEHRLLVVGGRLRSSLSGIAGGGLTWVDLDDPSRTVGLDIAKFPAVALHTSAIVVDSVTRRTFVAMYGICSETRLRNLGLLSIGFHADGTLIVERPMLSGVRAIARYDGDLYVGLRDDNGGFGCDGYPIQNGLFKPQAGGSAALVRVEPPGGGISMAPPVTALGGASLDAIAVGTWRDGLFFQTATGGEARNPTSFRVSLFLEGIIRTSTALWIGGRTSHQPGDTPNLADAGPHGAARIELSPDGKVDTHKHFVTNVRGATDVGGLPSNDVRDLKLGPDGSVYLACATETVQQGSADRAVQPVFMVDGAPRPGGLAKINEAGEITVLIDDDVAPDVRAVALAPNGDAVAADAATGLWRVSRTGGVAEPVQTSVTVPFSAVPVSLWVGDADDIAVGYDRGLWVRLDGAEAFVDTTGYVWTIEMQDGVIVAGTDEGLLFVHPENTTRPALPMAPVGSAPPFRDATP